MDKDVNNAKYKFKDIHIGSLIKKRWEEEEVGFSRTCNYFQCHEEDIIKVFSKESLDSDDLLRWSKHLEYDFFRIYTQHLILYSPSSSVLKPSVIRPSSLPVFRKNIYTKEMIDFILDIINNKEKTRLEVIREYKIPKTTLYKWISKYGDNMESMEDMGD